MATFDPSRLAYCSKHAHYMDIQVVRDFADVCMNNGDNPLTPRIRELMCDLRETKLEVVEEGGA